MFPTSFPMVQMHPNLQFYVCPANCSELNEQGLLFCIQDPGFQSVILSILSAEESKALLADDNVLWVFVSEKHGMYNQFVENWGPKMANVEDVLEWIDSIPVAERTVQTKPATKAQLDLLPQAPKMQS